MCVCVCVCVYWTHLNSKADIGMNRLFKEHFNWNFNTHNQIDLFLVCFLIILFFIIPFYIQYSPLLT